MYSNYDVDINHDGNDDNDSDDDGDDECMMFLSINLSLVVECCLRFLILILFNYDSIILHNSRLIVITIHLFIT